jgi:hypothetical protein
MKTGVTALSKSQSCRKTSNLYIRTDETLSDTTDALDDWEVLNKCQLGKRRPLDDNIFTMYALEEDLACFEEKVTATFSFWRNVRIITLQSVERGAR